MKIAVLGGSFDPPHIGHYFITRQILELRLDIDKILLVPAHQHQWKPIQASVEDRVQMLKCLENEKIEISDIEIKRAGISYTIDTIKELKKTTNAFIYWVVGSDILHEFDRWEKTEELLALATFLVFPRDPYHIPENVPKGFEVIKDSGHLITTNISSTVIRQRIKENKSIKYLVTKEIEEYISENNLYK
ncbi:MAG: nicotinate (nicotinamide) nucleotide adenylyltransferase [Patescibacteria group bacterium]|nr:nicotinate (nicotinamide) nucleotide adenylyltransferase [Patescibacteria group bacterium]